MVGRVARECALAAGKIVNDPSPIAFARRFRAAERCFRTAPEENGREFQTRHGIAARGELGSQTLLALGEVDLGEPVAPLGAAPRRDGLDPPNPQTHIL
jgi:hypothetical protein